MKKIVIVSHSGGLDSSVLIAKAISMGYDVSLLILIMVKKTWLKLPLKKMLLVNLKKCMVKD